MRHSLPCSSVTAYTLRCLPSLSLGSVPVSWPLTCTAPLSRLRAIPLAGRPPFPAVLVGQFGLDVEDGLAAAGRGLLVVFARRGGAGLGARQRRDAQDADR